MMSEQIQPSPLPSQELQERLYQTIQGTFSHEFQIRSAAEESLQQLQDSEPYAGLALCNIILFASDLSVRQMTLLLRKYIQQYWSPVHPQFSGKIANDEVSPELTPGKNVLPVLTPKMQLRGQAKEGVRHLLLQALVGSEKKIRVACAYAISTIAQSDYPDAWPALLPTLHHYLQSGQPQAIHGAMHVLAEFVRQEAAENEMIAMMREIGPVLLEILNADKSEISARISAVQIFRNCVRTLYTVKDQYPDLANNAVAQLLPTWMESLRHLIGAFTNAEALMSGRGWEILGLGEEIFRTFITVQNCFARIIQTHLAEYIDLAAAQLVILYPVFEKYYVDSHDDAPEPPTEDMDRVAEEGAVSGIPEVASSVFDFLTAMSRARAAKGIFSRSDGAQPRDAATEVHLAIIDSALKYAQMKRDEETEWLEDPNAFIADEDDETESYGLRNSAFDLIGSLLDRFATVTAVPLLQKARDSLVKAEEMRHQGRSAWWKQVDAALAVLGAVADDLLDLKDEEQETGVVDAFGLDGLLKEQLPQLLQMHDLPFLQGRVFVFASQYVLALENAGITELYLDGAISALKAEDVSVPVKISAVKTIRNFCRYIDAAKLAPRSGIILGTLIPYLKSSSDESLLLIMEAIRGVIGVDKRILTPENTVQLVQIVLEVWLANAEDPMFTNLVEETFELIASTESEETFDSLVHTAAPFIASKLQPSSDAENISLPATALELVNATLRGRKGSPGERLGPMLWPALFGGMLATEDNDMLQIGCETLTLFVRKDSERLLTWRGQDGQTGLQRVLQLLSKLVQPDSNESGGLFVGDLILHLLRNAGAHLNDIIPELLHALVRRIATASTGLFIQTLALPFAYLFFVAKDVTLKLLSEIEEDGQSGLQIVLQSWCDEAVSNVQGSYSIRINNLAMLNLFPLSELSQVMVRGELLVDESNRDKIMTRSKTKEQPFKYTQIPFPVRALKYLLSEMQNAAVRKDENNLFADEGLEEDDGDDDWENDDPLDNLKGKEEMAFLSDLMTGNLSAWAEGEDGQAQEDDEDLMNDPVVQLDMEANITSALRQAYAQNTNNIHEMIPQLTDTERSVFQKVLTI